MKKDETSLRSWWEFMTEDKKPSRKSGKGLERSLHWFLDTGPQKKGGYKNKRNHFGKKKFNDISAPRGAPGGLEEEVERESFDAKDILEPNLWIDGDNLSPAVRDRLIEIAENFIRGLDIEVAPVDVRLTGSIANYNWSDYSDIDLHIVVDFDELDSDPVIVKKFFDASRLRWNDRHDVKIFGYEVEIYVEDAREQHHSSGVYSLLKEDWLVEADPDQAQDAWSVEARKKTDDILTQLNLIQHVLPRKPKAALRSIERLRRKISNMRRAGLESKEREYSTGNVVFKMLRREDALRRLNDLKDQAYDAAFSI
tara:strand:+ start:209 stop:1141 length:933 start_codon:yes stop_codon:yes gene_type:complete